MKKQFYIGSCIRSFAISFKLRFASSMVFMLLILAWGGVHAMAQTVAPICPAGYAYNSGTKKCETTKPKVCPEGTIAFQGGLCGKRINALCQEALYEKVPASSTPNHQGCRRKNNSLAIPMYMYTFCPNDYNKDREDFCVGKTYYQKVCPAGFTWRTTDKVCVSQKTPSCPQGYRFNAQVGRCTIVQTGTPQ
jgi:hypothetical protein